MKKISLFIIILVSIEKIKAQSASGEVNSVNQIKIGLTPLIFNTYSVNYERAVGDDTGLSLGVKLQPSSGFPLKSILVPLLSDDDEETETTLNNLAFKHTAVTPVSYTHLQSSVKTNFFAIGYARVFRLVGSTWFIESEFKGNQKHTQYFGQSVAISADGNRIAIGGLNYQDPQGNEGEVGPCRGCLLYTSRCV